MAKNNNLTDFLKDLADGIRAKKGTSGVINPQNFRSEIESIQTGTDTSDATAAAGDILSGKTAYVKGTKVSGSMPNIGYNGNSPTIVYDSTNHLFKPYVSYKKGYYNGYNTYGTSKTPSSFDENLTPENIKKGVSIFGVTGTHEGGGGGESGGLVEQTGALDILQLNSTAMTRVGCKLYFPTATYRYEDFYENSGVLYGTLIEFSDGTKLYGKPSEGYALYLLYGGVEYTIWSSGGWTQSAMSATSEETSTFVIPAGTTVVVNNSGNGYTKAGRFMVSNAKVTVASEVANSMFNKIPSSYTIDRWDTDTTYDGVTCAQIQFLTTPEIVFPYYATTENTYIYFDHTGLSMQMQLRAVRIPSTGLAGAKLSDLVFLFDDSGGYVSYGMGLSLGGSLDIPFTVGGNIIGRHILAIHCNGKEICMSSYNQYNDGYSSSPIKFIT